MVNYQEAIDQFKHSELTMITTMKLQHRIKNMVLYGIVDNLNQISAMEESIRTHITGVINDFDCNLLESYETKHLMFAFECYLGSAELFEHRELEKAEHIRRYLIFSATGVPLPCKLAYMKIEDIPKYSKLRMYTLVESVTYIMSGKNDSYNVKNELRAHSVMFNEVIKVHKFNPKLIIDFDTSLAALVNLENLESHVPSKLAEVLKDYITMYSHTPTYTANLADIKKVEKHLLHVELDDPTTYKNMLEHIDEYSEEEVLQIHGHIKGILNDKDYLTVGQKQTVRQILAHIDGYHLCALAHQIKSYQ